MRISFIEPEIDNGTEKTPNNCDHEIICLNLKICEKLICDVQSRLALPFALLTVASYSNENFLLVSFPPPKKWGNGERMGAK